MTETASAYQVLQQLAEKSLSHAQQLPSQIDTVEQWSGIGFSLLGYRFVIPMGELAEMLEIPVYTRLPGVQPWIKGVSNIRGRLLPLFDLAAFYSGALSGHKKHQRLLVVDNPSAYVGLWVDQVLGRQYFDADAKQASDGMDLPEKLAKCIDGYFEMDDQQWMVFSLKSLAQDPEFIDVAAS